MSEKDFDPDALMDAMAPFLGLSLVDDYRAGIATHLLAAYSIAQDVMTFETGDESEPAPVYKP